MYRAALLLVSLVALAAGPAAAVEVRLIGVTTIPHQFKFEDTIVGGLSGIDYDAAHDRWLAISDDKSEASPARFYEIRLDYDAERLTGAMITGVTLLRQRDGTTYPNRFDYAQRGGEVPDLESLRLDPRDGTVWYTSEGDRGLGLQPFVRHARRDGKLLGELPRPAVLSFTAAPGTGARHNLTFEGLTFAPDGDSLWIGMEGPLYQDGPLPTPAAGALTRFTHVGRDGKVLGQFAYPIDPIPVTPPPGKLADNGVPEILTLPRGGLLVLERSGHQDIDGKWSFTVRLFEADLGDATDVAALSALTGAAVKPARKRLVYDFAKAGQPWVDNLEGIAWGRPLANGHRTLVVVSDDNFSPTQQTQLWVFEALGDVPATPAASTSDPWDRPFAGMVHDEKKIGGFIGEYRWLSNFFPCRVEWEGRVYRSAEAAYQSAKFPPAERDAFTTLEPDAAKKLAHAKPLADEAAWNARKESVMREILWAKFAQNPALATKLRATGTRTLEETNSWGDQVWGVYQGKGDNLLGRLLMETRGRLDGPSPFH